MVREWLYPPTPWHQTPAGAVEVVRDLFANPVPFAADPASVDLFADAESTELGWSIRLRSDSMQTANEGWRGICFIEPRPHASVLNRG